MKRILGFVLLLSMLVYNDIYAYPLHNDVQHMMKQEVKNETKLKKVITASRKRVKAAKEERERKAKEEKLAALKMENPSFYYLECDGYDRCGRKLDPDNTCGKSSWTGPELTQAVGIISYAGTCFTFYNQPMGGCFRLHGESIAPYSIADAWVSDKGIKMVGPYVMCAAYTPWFPPGSLVSTPFGIGMVIDYNGHCDLPGGTKADIDICTTWGHCVPN